MSVLVRYKLMLSLLNQLKLCYLVVLRILWPSNNIVKLVNIVSNDHIHYQDAHMHERLHYFPNCLKYCYGKAFDNVL